MALTSITQVRFCSWLHFHAFSPLPSQTSIDSLHRCGRLLWSPQTTNEGTVRSVNSPCAPRPSSCLRNSPGKYPSHTVHVDDIAGAMWAAAEWMAKTGRTEADALAGEEIVFKNDKSKVKEVEGMVPPDQKCVAPAFNIVRTRRSPQSTDTDARSRRTTATPRWPISATSLRRSSARPSSSTIS